MNLDSSDKQFFIATILVPIVLWWIFTGRRKYSIGGLR